MLLDYWAHTYFEDPRKRDNTIEDESFDLDATLAAINAEAESDLANTTDWEDVKPYGE